MNLDNRLLPRWYKRTPEALEYFNGTRAAIKEMFNDARTEIRKGIKRETECR